MFEVKVLNSEELKDMLPIGEVINAVETVYGMKAAGKTDLFPMLTQDLEEGISDFDIKSGAISEAGIYGMKTVSYFANNIKQGLPNLAGVLNIYDINTGFPIGVMDAGYITSMRTGAAGALGAKYLARPESENLLLVGAGKQAVFQIAATLQLMGNIKTVRIYDPVIPTGGDDLAKKMPDILKNDFKYEAAHITFQGVTNIEEATRQSDVIITCTPSRSPIIQKAWVAPGTHFSCVGSDVSGKQEIDENIMAGARIFVDDVSQCCRVGEIEISLKKNIISQEDIAGEIGGLVQGTSQGRQTPEQITIYDTTGLALQDLVVAKKALDLAKEHNIGTIIHL